MKLILIILIISLIFILLSNNNKKSTIKSIPRIIWIYWNDELIDAPDIVQLCVNLIKKFNTNCKINILNDNNYKNYVKDQNVIDIMNKNIMNMYKSDVLRLYLIYNYGGLYVDASLLPFQSFEWIFNIMEKSNKKLFLYKNTNHTRNNKKPIFENWMIMSEEKNYIIKLILNKLIQSINNGITKSYNELKKDNIDYQGFTIHSEYHLTYFIIINLFEKNKLHNQIEYLNCTHDDYPCKLFFSNEKLKDLYEKKLSFNEFKIFSKKNKFLKLTSYNRNFIKKQKLQPEKNSIMYYLLNL